MFASIYAGSLKYRVATELCLYSNLRTFNSAFKRSLSEGDSQRVHMILIFCFARMFTFHYYQIYFENTEYCKKVRIHTQISFQTLFSRMCKLRTDLFCVHMTMRQIRDCSLTKGDNKSASKTCKICLVWETLL